MLKGIKVRKALARVSIYSNVSNADNVVPPSTDVEWMEEADISKSVSMLAGLAKWLICLIVIWWWKQCYSPNTSLWFFTCRLYVLVLKLLNLGVVFLGPIRTESLFCRHSPVPSTSVVDSGTCTRRLVATLRDDGGNVKIHNGNENREYALLSRYLNHLCIG